ncbi:hypothetical protein D9758_006349 [Tetrapyrgos nigripes]|uniref:Uncharacterized protein n=1 Tax=Tetrapyrgos nigripes TaxID=182062 RepID=A0A8H5D8J4_9AGAR|nr:hypothetical protein D9758_006349 [Tetrapyrgos nigripes]
MPQGLKLQIVSLHELHDMRPSLNQIDAGESPSGIFKLFLSSTALDASSTRHLEMRSATSLLALLLASSSLCVALSTRQNGSGSLKQLLIRQSVFGDTPGDFSDIPPECQTPCQPTITLLNTCLSNPADTSCGCADSDINNLSTCFDCVTTSKPDTKSDADDTLNRAKSYCQDLNAAGDSGKDSGGAISSGVNGFALSLVAVGSMIGGLLVL